MSDLQRYTDAMAANHLDECIRIEQQFGLYGYTPEIVSVGLAAAEKGERVGEAVDRFLEGGARCQSDCKRKARVMSALVGGSYRMQQCKRRVKKGQDYCWQHDKAISAIREG